MYLLALLAVCVAPAPAGAADPRHLLEQARLAGGGAAWNAVRSLHIAYRSTSSGRSATIDRLEDVQTGRFVTRSVFANATYADGFDGVSVWTQGKSGVSYVLGDEDARLGAANDSFRTERGWWFRNRRPATIEDAGRRREAGRDFNTIRITPEGGRPFTLWFDVKTHLIDRDIEQGAEEVYTSRFSDYRAVDGVMLPFTIRLDGEVDTLTHVALNVPFAETSFSLPPAPPPPVKATRGGVVKIRFRLEADRVIIPVTIDGQGPFDCEFDSGGGLLIPPALVRRLALGTTGTARAYGGGEGFVTSTRGALKSLSIGAANLGSQAFSSFTFSDEFPQRLLAGVEILQRYVVNLNFDTLKMTLTPPRDFRYAGNGAIIPFHFEDNQPEVIGAVDGIAGTFAVDTGDAGSLLLIAPFARRYHLAQRYHAHLSYSGRAVAATHGVYARAGSVVIDGADGRPAVRVSRPVTRISEQRTGFDANAYVSGNLGIGILKQFNLTFDYSRHDLIFERNRFYGQPDIFDRTGMRLRRTVHRWTVTSIYAGGPAAKAGVHEGDSILRINGKSLSTLDSGRLRVLTRGPIGSIVDLQIRAGRSSRHVKITLREVL